MNKPSFTIFGPCDVCVRVKRDRTQKLTAYCSFCDAYICKKHWKKYGARAKAAFKKMTEKKRKK